jgi:hypothetical protein
MSLRNLFQSRAMIPVLEKIPPEEMSFRRNLFQRRTLIPVLKKITSE